MRSNLFELINELKVQNMALLVTVTQLKVSKNSTTNQTKPTEINENFEHLSCHVMWLSPPVAGGYLEKTTQALPGPVALISIAVSRTLNKTTDKRTIIGAIHSLVVVIE